MGLLRKSRRRLEQEKRWEEIEEKVDSLRAMVAALRANLDELEKK